MGAVVFTSSESKYAGAAVFQNRQQVVSMVTVSEELYRGFFSNSSWRSVFNDATRQVLVCNKPSAMVWGFGYTARSTTKYDVTKCYTSILRDMECLVSFNGCDRLEDYNGEPLEDWCMYLVKKLGDDVCFPLKRHSLCFGKHLKTAVGRFSVLKVLRPSHRTPNFLADKLKKVFTHPAFSDWKSKGFTENPCKHLSNTTIGLMGQHERKCWKGNVFDDNGLDEAVKFQEENGGSICHFECDGEPTGLYLQSTSDNMRLKDGYLPIHHFIVEEAVVKMLDLLDDLRSCGYEAVKVSTDCVEVETNAEAEADFRRAYGKKWFRDEGDEWDRIGGLRVEYCNWTVRKDNTEIVENPLLLPEEEVVEVEEVKVENEWDLDLRSVGKKCAVEAVMPGSGKTFVSKRVADEERMLFVVPNHKIETNLLREGYDAITVDHLLGFHPTRHAEGLEFEQRKTNTKFVVKGKEVSLLDYKYVTFDEVLLLPVNKIYAVKEFVDKYDATLAGVYFNYDPFQNKSPDERLANIDPKKIRAYKLRVCREIAGRYVVLKEMKRNTNRDNVRHYEKMKEMLGRNDLDGMVAYLLQNCNVVGSVSEVSTDMNLAYTNSQCDLINEHVYRLRRGTEPWSVGLKVIYKGKTQRVTGSKARFYKNDDYEIVRVEKGKDKDKGKDEVVLRHVLGEESSVSMKQLKAFFKLPYCWTGHSTQGSTIDTPYTIDLNCTWINCEWLWTAVTRCTDWSLIRVLYNNGLREAFRQRFAAKVAELVDGYVQQDLRAKRYIACESDYIDADWLNERVGGECCMCGEPLDMTGGMECFSVDRIDGDLAHTKENCQILCRWCNVVKR
jgi:hypothetical protein